MKNLYKKNIRKIIFYILGVKTRKNDNFRQKKGPFCNVQFIIEEIQNV